jgi:class 3 adenylate cyclase
MFHPDPPRPIASVRSERKLAAIMFTDIVGFSRQMGADEARMLRLLAVHNQIVQQAVTTHHGHIIKTIGDAFLVDFPSVIHAVQGAQQIQTHLSIHNVEQDKTEQIHMRIGIHQSHHLLEQSQCGFLQKGDGNASHTVSKDDPAATRSLCRSSPTLTRVKIS